jgi:WD40 repeat protein
LTVLLIGSGTTLWWRWAPWATEFEISRLNPQPVSVRPFQDLLPITRNGNVCLYSLNNGKLVHEFHQMEFIGSSDRLNLLVMRDLSKSLLRIFRKDTFNYTFEEQSTLSDPDSDVGIIQFSPSGEFLVTTGIGTPEFWDLKSGVRRFALGKTQFGFSNAAISPDNQWIVTENGDELAHVWNAATGAEIRTLRGHNAEICDVALSPEGTFVATASADQTVKIWESRTGACFATLHGYTEEDPNVLKGYYRVTFSPDGKELATLSQHSLTLWSANGQFEKIRTIVVPPKDYIVDFSFQTRRLAAAEFEGQNGDIAMYDIDSGEQRCILNGHQRRVTSAHFLPNENRFVSSAGDGTVRMWTRRRPEYRAGIAVLPEFWLTIIFSIALLWNLRQDLRRH